MHPARLALLSPLVALALALPATAQTQTGTEAPAAQQQPAETVPAAQAPVDTGLSMGKPEGAEGDGGVGSTYVQATHGDWEQRCVRTEDGSDPCQLYQLLKDETGNAVAEFSIFSLPEGQEAAAGATAIVPLETLLTSDLSLQIDNAPAKKYPFSWCSPIGCIARIGFTAAEVEAMKKGSAGKITIVPVVAPDQQVTVAVSLKGFTAGLAAVDEANKPASGN